MRSSVMLLLVSGLIAVASGQARSGMIVVDFDDLGGFGDVPDGYGGINWHGGWAFDAFPEPPYVPHSGNGFIYNAPSSATSEDEYIHDDFFTFVTPARFEGAWFSGGGSPSSLVAFELFDKGLLVHTSDSLHPTGTSRYLASGYAGLVDRVVVHETSVNNSDYVIDDVTYSTAAVPEPSSLVLSALGVLSVLGVGRLRRWSGAVDAGPC